MEFKINFAFIVCVFFVVIFTISLIDEIVKAIRNKRKKDVNEQAFVNLLDYTDCCQRDFLIKEHGFTDEQLDNKSGKELCNECGYKNMCGVGCYPKCLGIDPDVFSSFDSDWYKRRGSAFVNKK